MLRRGELTTSVTTRGSVTKEKISYGFVGKLWGDLFNNIFQTQVNYRKENRGEVQKQSIALTLGELFNRVRFYQRFHVW